CFFSSRRRHTRLVSDWSSDVCSSDLLEFARSALGDQGHLVAQGTPGELKRQMPGSHVRLRFAGDLELDSAMRILPGSTREDEERSEERRVGKEWRSRRARGDERRKRA